MFDIALAIALTAASNPPAPPPNQSSERICRGGGARQLGSHVRTRRRCLTAEQWQMEDAEKARSPGLQITPGQNDGRAPVRPG